MVVWFAHVRVGHRQALNTKTPDSVAAGGFSFVCPKYDQPHNPPHPKKLIFIKDWPTRTTKRASNRDTHQSPFLFATHLIKVAG